MPDNTAAAAFWGPLVFVAVAFWPEYALHGRASVIAGIAWWGTITIIGLFILAAYLAVKRQARTRPSVAETVARSEAILRVLENRPAFATGLEEEMTRLVCPHCGKPPAGPEPHWWNCPEVRA